ncbi:MAG: hypothetical protein WC438_00735 [Candidatus Pacearchaeota archaeon]
MKKRENKEKSNKKLILLLVGLVLIISMLNFISADCYYGCNYVNINGYKYCKPVGGDIRWHYATAGYDIEVQCTESRPEFVWYHWTECHCKTYGDYKYPEMNNVCSGSSDGKLGSRAYPGEIELGRWQFWGPFDPKYVFNNCTKSDNKNRSCGFTSSPDMRNEFKCSPCTGKETTIQYPYPEIINHISVYKNSKPCNSHNCASKSTDGILYHARYGSSCYKSNLNTQYDMFNEGYIPIEKQPPFDGVCTSDETGKGAAGCSSGTICEYDADGLGSLFKPTHVKGCTTKCRKENSRCYKNVTNYLGTKIGNCAPDGACNNKPYASPTNFGKVITSCEKSFVVNLTVQDTELTEGTDRITFKPQIYCKAKNDPYYVKVVYNKQTTCKKEGSGTNVVARCDLSFDLCSNMFKDLRANGGSCKVNFNHSVYDGHEYNSQSIIEFTATLLSSDFISCTAPEDAVNINNAAPEVINEELSVSSIPLLNVLGRGGLDFPLTLNYNAGIKVKQEASWVGLGWNLNIPYISRNPQGKPDDVDFEDSTDDYYSPWGRLIKSGDSFVTENWQPIKIEYFNDLGDKQIDRWVITDMDGTSYVFANPVNTRVVSNISYKNMCYKYNVTTGQWNIDETFSESPSQLNSLYAYAWYLTEIHSADYIDSGNNIADDNDYGNWIKINYQSPSYLQNLNYNYPGLGNRADYELYESRENYGSCNYSLRFRGYALNISYSYPSEIITPLYTAKFNLDTNGFRTDAKAVNGQSPASLKNIELRSRLSITPNEVIKKIEFGYASGDYKLANGKHTLSQIQEYGKDSESLPPTKFYYDYNPTYDPYAYDWWGYYNGKLTNDNQALGSNCIDLDNHEVNTNEIDAWSLNEIKWSTGGITNYIYEPNEYNYILGTKLASSRFGGGLRLFHISNENGLTGDNFIQSSKNYYYGDLNSNVFGVATKMPNGSQMINENSAIGGKRYRVDYPLIEEETPGYGSVLTELRTALDTDSLEGSNPVDYTIGLPKDVKYLDENKNIVGQIINAWNFEDRAGYKSGLATLGSVETWLDGTYNKVDYTYDYYGLIKEVYEYGLDNFRRTEIDYAYEWDVWYNPFSLNFINKNMLSQTKEMRVYSKEGLESESDIKYDRFNSYLGGEQYYPSEIYGSIDAVNGDFSTIQIGDYDGYGNPRWVADSMGNQYFTRYSSEYNYAYPTSGWNQVYGSEGSPSWKIEYDKIFGKPQVTYDANNKATTYQYDNFERLKYVWYPDYVDGSPSEEYSYYIAGDDLAMNNLNSVTTIIKLDDTKNYQTSSFYDGSLNLLVSGVENGDRDIFYRTYYDGAGMPTTTYGPYYTSNYDSVPVGTPFDEVYYEDSPLARLEGGDYSGNLGNPYLITYTNEGAAYSVTQYKDAASQTFKTKTDPLGGIVETTDAKDKKTFYDNDILNRVNFILNPLNQPVFSELDDQGNPLILITPDSGASDLTWNPDGSLEDYSDELNNVHNEYDKLGRIKMKTYSDGNYINYTYDIIPSAPPGGLRAGLDNSVGRISSIYDSKTGVTTNYFWDVRGRPGVIDKIINGVHYVKEYFFDYNNNLIKEKIKENEIFIIEIEKEYNRLDNPTVTKLNGVQSAQYVYDTNKPWELYEEEKGSSSIHTFYYYDPTGSYVTGERITDGTSVLSEKSYVYDTNGNVKEIHEGLTQSNLLASFEYDELGQLVGINDNGYIGKDYSFTLDDIGKVLSINENGKETIYSYYPDTNLLLSDGEFTYNYNLNGQVDSKTDILTKEKTEYVYDKQGRLSKVNFPNGEDIEYVYDADGLIGKYDKEGNYINLYAGEIQESDDSKIYDNTNNFYIENSQNETVAVFSDLGDIVLKGTCSINLILNPPANSFVIENSVSKIAYVDMNGNFAVKGGSCFINSSICNSNGLVIRNNEGKVVISIDKNGNLCYTGKVYTNADF